jgi:hypothetical protein
MEVCVSKQVIGMVLNASGPRRKIGSPKEQALKIFNIIRSLGNSHVQNGSRTHEGQNLDTFNVQAHIASNQHVHEVEAQKTFVIGISHHDS